MTGQIDTKRKHPLLIALTIIIAICAVPFILFGIADAAKEQRR